MRMHIELMLVVNRNLFVRRVILTKDKWHNKHLPMIFKHDQLMHWNPIQNKIKIFYVKYINMYHCWVNNFFFHFFFYSYVYNVIRLSPYIVWCPCVHTLQNELPGLIFRNNDENCTQVCNFKTLNANVMGVG